MPDVKVPPGHKLAGKRNLKYFKDVPEGHEFTANHWGHGKSSRFVKRDHNTGTNVAVYKKHGHPRGWGGRTQFGMRDIVVHHGPTKHVPSQENASMKLEIDGKVVELAAGDYVRRGNRIISKTYGIIEVEESRLMPNALSTACMRHMQKALKFHEAAKKLAKHALNFNRRHLEKHLEHAMNEKQIAKMTALKDFD